MTISNSGARNGNSSDLKFKRKKCLQKPDESKHLGSARDHEADVTSMFADLFKQIA